MAQATPQVAIPHARPDTKADLRVIDRRARKRSAWWSIFRTLIYGGIKLPMADEKPTGERPPIVQWPVFIFLAGIVMMGFSTYQSATRDSSKDAVQNAATMATVLEKLNSLDSSLKADKDIRKGEVDEIRRRLQNVEDAQGDIEAAIGLRIGKLKGK